MVRRVGAFVALVLVLTTSLAVRADDANRECDNAQDVTVVVDFGHLGGGVNVRCAPQGADGIKTGFDALEHANITYEQSGGFLCRIAGKPESTDCTNRPGSGPYWAYYYAKRGEDWKYSNQGAGARKPPPGSFEGWAYANAEGDASPPRYPVPGPLPEATTTTAAAATPPPPPGAPPPSPTSRVRNSSGTAPTTPHTGVTTTSTVEVAAAATTTSSSLKLGSVDLSVDQGGDGTSTGFILSVVSLTGLAAAAFVFLRLRGR